MNETKYYQHYCTGCGLCSSVNGIEMEQEGHFLVPKLKNDDWKFCRNVCPVNGIQFNKSEYSSRWGRYEDVYSGWSADDEIRYKASSGGVLSGLALYLIESGEVDGVLQIRVGSSPLTTELVCSKDRDSVVTCCGSRYISSSPLASIAKYFNDGCRYAFIGKPCDAEALKNFLLLHPDLQAQFPYLLTFFCAGAPSRAASINLSEDLGVSEDQIYSIRYRGYGWPGKATVTSVEGSTAEMPYIESWNNYLGKDVRKMCKFCVNGTGEFADISCGDLWSLKNNAPDFSEKPGVNIVFARSKKGKRLLELAAQAGYLHLEPYTLNEDLERIQPKHSDMRASCLAKVIGLRFIGKRPPRYSVAKMIPYWKLKPVSAQIRTILGTVKRGVRGRL